MRKTSIGLVILCCLLAMPLVSQDTTEGKWTAKVKGDNVKMKMKIMDDDSLRHGWNYCRTFKKSDFIDLQWDRDHTFRLVREAGTISFKGKFSGKSGEGDFTFHPGKKFKEFLEGKGFD
ncbi:MAG: hypothetical protein GTO45_26150, partial [Candidatus Aminicenantes bacterium]|nr:hypothetical protein [Candidatus Aminicenantes bacterium]NIM82221.1 hypothetical protein [Candidatus Aminicenantes bacterium]NIN21621.1 hypothetical protein [Candidatus Aminicenantes bacterium]NIN45432.1 hypothetical protein [Candidatus Aminicenantes bacterium]NIN88253.1 hypothetical protein [Candidatus Aminicenantes bacterium]